MTDKKNSNPSEKDQSSEDEKLGVMNIPVTIHSQYIKDLSFENPLAPNSLSIDLPMPQLEVNIGMDAGKIEHPELNNYYEVTLSASATAKRGNETVFIAEIAYGATVSIGDIVPIEQHHPILLIEAPRLLFPYVRQILGTVTQQGGFPPLLLAPVDFQALYLERFKDQIQQGQEQAEQEAAKGNGAEKTA